ncbi:MAG: TOBE domain-containing protein [Helicobacteraceae bacterium]|jgi:molybdate transport system regulatory protein|nr:TOBE domain-containing protein [Helicobacteraceae bacterium]
MNKMNAVITAIESFEGITIVSFESASQPMRMMALELDETLQVGSKVLLGAKASNIALAKGALEMLSISNCLDTVVDSVENGVLLSSVKLRFGESLLISVITRDSSKRINLQPGDHVTALIKASELSVLEIKR